MHSNAGTEEALTTYRMFWFAAALAASANIALAGDATAGRKVYLSRCQTCHSVDKGGSNKLGPLLFGIMGKKAGTLPGYAYSRPLKNSKFVWNDDALRNWLKRPNQTLPGTRMAFAGLSNPQQIEDLIAYMHTLK
jgi:cytochrome c